MGLKFRQLEMLIIDDNVPLRIDENGDLRAPRKALLKSVDRGITEHKERIIQAFHGYWDMIEGLANERNDVYQQMGHEFHIDPKSLTYPELDRCWKQLKADRKRMLVELKAFQGSINAKPA